MSTTPDTMKAPVTDSRAAEMFARLSTLPPFESARLLRSEPEEVAAGALMLTPVPVAVDILARLPAERRDAIAAAAPAGHGKQWLQQCGYPEGSVGRLMEAPLATFGPAMTVEEATAELRELVKTAFVTYGFVVENDGRLVGVIAFRELLFSHPKQPLSEIMVNRPFSLRADLHVIDAMREVLTRHFPVYPVCDAHGH